MNDVPMTKEQFKRAMTAGLGRCYIQLKTGEKETYRDVVQYGCLHNFSYDTQSNGTKERYVYRLVKCYDDPFSFLPPLAELFRSLDFSKTIDWDIVYFSRLLTLFARDGAREAADAIRYRYETALNVLKDPDRTVEGYVDEDEEIYTILGEALLAIDGTDAYVKVATDMNDLNVRFHIRCFDLPWLVSAINELPETPDFAEYVRKHAGEDVSAFLEDYEIAKKDVYGEYDDEYDDEYVEETEAERDDEEPEEQEDGIDEAKETPTYEPFYRWALGCEDKRVLERYPVVEEGLLAAREESAGIVRELEAFYEDPDGIPFERLSPYLESYDDEIRFTAQDIFSIRTDEAAARYAIKRLMVKGPERWTMPMLIRSYKPEYESVLVYMMQKMRFEMEEECWHAVVYAIAKTVESGQVELPPSILTIAYERSLCMICREKIFGKMYENGWLTPEEKRACRFDASDEIARFAEEHRFPTMRPN